MENSRYVRASSEEAKILPDNERERVERLAQKYRIDRFTVYPLYRLVMRLRGRGSHSHEPPVALLGGVQLEEASDCSTVDTQADYAACAVDLGDGGGWHE